MLRTNAAGGIPHPTASRTGPTGRHTSARATPRGQHARNLPLLFQFDDAVKAGGTGVEVLKFQGTIIGNTGGKIGPCSQIR